MKTIHYVAALLLVAAVVAPFWADAKDDDGFKPMWNGKDLTGWVNVNCAPSSFYVKDDMIITTGKPTGFLRTEKQYENFIAEFDWMHIPPKPGAVGNSGFFVWADPIPAVGTGYTRGIEVQVLVNLTYKNKKGEITATSQGDLFSIWGATCEPERPHPDGWARCLPSGNFCKGENEWNHYRVEANDGVIKLSVNGHFVSSVSKCSPRKGYLALESEGSECRFKNLKIKELPSTNPKPEEIANVSENFKQMFTGLDLSGWQASDDVKKHWKPADWMLRYDGSGHMLRSEKTYGDAEFIADFRFPAKKDKIESCIFVLREATKTEQGVTLSIAADGGYQLQAGGGASGGKLTGMKPAGQWNRMRATLKGIKFTATVNGAALPKLEVSPVADKGAFVLQPDGAMDFGNLFVRQLDKADK
jgi:hypothetical protein